MVLGIDTELGHSFTASHRFTDALQPYTTALSVSHVTRSGQEAACQLLICAALSASRQALRLVDAEREGGAHGELVALHVARLGSFTGPSHLEDDQ